MLASTLVLLGLIGLHAKHVDRVDENRLGTLEALRQSELFFHTLVETLPQNILLKDADGRFTFVNRRFCDTVGRTREDLLGQTDAGIFPVGARGKVSHG